MSSLKTIKTKMCRDTFGIMLDYLVGDKTYWKKIFNKSLNSLKNKDFMSNILYYMRENRKYSDFKKKSKDFKSLIGQELFWNPSHNLHLNIYFSHITKSGNIIGKINGRKKTIKTMEYEGFGFVIFTDKGKTYAFMTNDQENYVSHNLIQVCFRYMLLELCFDIWELDEKILRHEEIQKYIKCLP
jgi:hypothetical protein